VNYQQQEAVQFEATLAQNDNDFIPDNIGFTEENGNLFYLSM
jgi:hypothetical protein